MVNKVILVIVIIVSLLIISIGGYFYIANQSIPLNDYFDISINPVVNWDDNTHELFIQKEIPTKFNESYENVTVKINFFKGSKYINSSYVTNNTKDGKLFIVSNIKLPEKPDKYTFEVIEGDLTQSNKKALDYKKNN